MTRSKTYTFAPSSALGVGLAAIASVLALSACDPGAVDEEGLDLGQLLAGGKGDLGNNARIEAISTQSIARGAFVENQTIYGYVLELGEGATIHAGAVLGDPEAPHNLLMSVNAGYASPNNPGALVATTSDGTVDFTASEAGRYLVAFTTFDDAAGASFELEIGCEGSEAQCGTRRSGDCDPTQLVLQGGTLQTDTTWSNCNVDVLEPYVVDEGATLVVSPGVTVTASRGTSLEVLGQLAVHGTEQAPVYFVARPDDAWDGLILSGQDNIIEHAVVRNGRNAIAIERNASGTVTDTVVEETFGNRSGTGVRAQSGSRFHFERALVRGFHTGMRIIDANDVRIEDSVIRDNGTGLSVQGGSTARDNRCHDPRPRPQTVRDPVIVHTDIIDNQEEGISTRGDSVLLQIEHSNILRNRTAGVQTRGPTMFDESFIRDSNVFDNGPEGSAQVVSWHRPGGNGLRLQDNYYGPFDDLGDLAGRVTAQCEGFFDFIGVKLDRIAEAGPRLDRLKPDIRQHCEHAE